MNYEEVIANLKATMLEDNTKDIIANFDSYEEKIASLTEKNPDLDFSNWKEEVKNNNPFVIALLRKDPVKQNLYENAFFEYIKEVKKLPQSGKGAIRFNNSKAADFQYKNWYGTQKYIRNYGGAQDNQLSDAATFAISGNIKGKKIIVCIDGEYGSSAIRELLTESEHCVIVNADELKEGINNGRFD